MFAKLSSLLFSRHGATRSSCQARQPRCPIQAEAFCPTLECLEDRTLPATFNVANVAQLIAAIETSNTNGEDNVINLVAGRVYNLTAIDNSDGGQGDNGLPVILNTGHSLTINGRGATIKRGNTTEDFRIFFVEGELILNRVTIANGRAPFGGGLFIGAEGSATLNQTRVVNNTAIVDGDFPHSGQGGGIYNDGGILVVQQNSKINGNQANGTTGQAGHGGGIYNRNGAVTLTDALIQGNTAQNAGGGIAQSHGSSGTLTVTNTTIRNNKAGIATSGGDGGGIVFDVGTVTITNSLIAQNVTTRGNGGGIAQLGGELSIDRSTLRDNRAEFAGGTLTGRGGGFFQGQGGGSGGAAPAGTTATITDSTIRDNFANGLGGGIEMTREVTLANCTIHGNQNRNFGGGISVRLNGELTATNCTITQNLTFGQILQGASGAAGVGVAQSGSSATFVNCTIVRNRDLSGAGGAGLHVFEQGGSPLVTLLNTIIALNTTINPANGPDVRTNQGAGAQIATATNSLIGILNSAATITTAVNLLSGSLENPLDPRLGPLGNYGGFTQTIGLLPGSPALNAGTNTGAPPADQRGLPRPFEGTSDIGAFEVQVPASLFTAVGRRWDR